MALWGIQEAPLFEAALCRTEWQCGFLLSGNVLFAAMRYGASMVLHTCPIGVFLGPNACARTVHITKGQSNLRL